MTDLFITSILLVMYIHYTIFIKSTELILKTYWEIAFYQILTSRLRFHPFLFTWYHEL